MKLRIYRTWKWEVVNDGLIGGRQRWAIAHHDQLQVLSEDGVWRPVNVVEAEKPDHPEERARREQAEAFAEKMKAAPPVDRSDRVLANGKEVTLDAFEIDPSTGMQKAYVVLSEPERKNGFVRPLRTTYIHDKCGVATTMALSIAETYARDPSFYAGTFCCGCKNHFPIGATGEFTWDDGTKVGT